MGNFILNDDAHLKQKDHVLYYYNLPLTGSLLTVNEFDDTLAVITYKNGLKNGFAKYYYTNGQIKESREYRNGKKSGAHAGYYEDGSWRFLFHYSGDVFDGECIEWYACGITYRKFNFENGKECGLQQMWNRDGSIYANYEVKDGRKFGLTGTRHCINETDSIQSY